MSAAQTAVGRAAADSPATDRICPAGGDGPLRRPERKTGGPGGCRPRRAL